MAKQYYIDENGTPIQVSGTVNTAELLPISGNDSTDTKTYIDNVGKTVVELTGNSDYITGASNKIWYVKIGNLVTVSGRFQVTTQKPSGQYSLFADLPKPKGDIASVNDSGNNTFIINNQGDLTANAVINTGYYNITCSYICN